MVEKAKQKLLLENCKYFFTDEKNNAKDLFLLEVFPAPLATGLVSYQYILTIFLINGDHLLFTM